MASGVRQEDARHGNSDGITTGSDVSAAEAALRARLSRKRTKTGCLTCRKRRIKCGEERPVCKNCVKSKRHCEGYNQRVVFKPTFDFRPVANGGAHITFQAGPVPGPATPFHPGFGPEGTFDPNFYGHLQPRPLEQYVPGFHDQHHVAFQEQAPQFVHLTNGSSAPLQPHPGYANAPNQQPILSNGLPSHPIQPATFTQAAAPYPPVHASSTDYGPHSAVSTVPQPNWQQPNANHDEKPTHFAPLSASGAAEKLSPTSSRSSKTLSWSHSTVAEDPSSHWNSGGYIPRPELIRPIDYQPPPLPMPYVQQQHAAVSIAPAVQIQNHVTPDFHDHEEHVPATNTPTHFLTQAAVEAQDDNYYDVQSDEEMETGTVVAVSGGHDRKRELRRILEFNNINIQDLQTRRYDTFIYGGILDHYRPEEAANPLNNPATARVFAHFISVTGPSLSIFERHPRNTSMLFTEGQIPFSQQGLWTYTMPMAALRNHGLLHAMLALASLHIARLQNASPTPSVLHYTWAVKRIHRRLSGKKTRGNMATLAASMLLGFYEVMTADHMKWNMHLSGSKQLFLETDFVTMTHQFRQMKADRAARQKLGNHWQPDSPKDQSQDEILDQIHDVDERVISDLVGREIRYDDPGRVMTSKFGMPPPLDLSHFEILKDVYWWYLKQDVYQSIVSGNPLLLDFSRWANCPPRAPLGKGDAVYGSFDHLVLLLGRIADFASRDRVRKLRQMEADDGQWRPAGGVKTPGQPQVPPPPTPTSATSGHHLNNASIPTPQPQGASPASAPQLFFGMAPPPRENVQMPSAYRSSHVVPTPHDASRVEVVDHQAAIQAALEEYGRIRAALHAFSNSLGEAFSPLSSDEQPTFDTPFGKALFYRSYDIGCLWAIYHMAVIIALRSHPHMHPAAHVAAAIAAQETHFFANEIGRIAAGIVPGPSDQPLNPTLGASLCESCMPSFFAAVQYQNTEQRHSTVLRIYNIALRTGWGSAELIANGCETAWVKTAASGRGPPYTRIVRPKRSDDPRLNGSWERLDPNGMPDERDEADRRLVRTKPNARLNWAIGIMGTEDDEGV